MLELSYKSILRVALPLMLGTFVQSIISITDGAFVSELGNTAFNAVGNGSMIYMAMFMLCRGIADGTQITIAKKYGEQKNQEIGQVLFNAQFIQIFITSIIFILLFIFVDAVVGSIAKSADIGNAMIEFLKYRSWGIFFAGLEVTMIAYFIGLGKTRIIIASTLLLAFSNIFLDYVLIFGKLGFPELGMRGAAIASSISEGVSFAFLLIYALNKKDLREFAYSLKLKVQRSTCLLLIKLSYPLMLQGLVAMSSWLLFFSLVEHMGPTNLEIAHHVRYMYFIAFIPLFGFGAATRTFVSNLVGREQQELIPGILLKLLFLSVASIVLVFHGAFFYPEKLIGIVQHNPHFTIQSAKESAAALQFVSGTILIFAIVIIPFNCISALGKTMHTFGIELISLLIYGLSCYLIIYKWHWNVVEIWWVEYIYFSSLGVISLLYLLHYKKKFLASKSINI